MPTATLPVRQHNPRTGIACESDAIETVPLTEERSFGYWQQEIPKEYWSLSAGLVINLQPFQ